jgi:hypothetical protein
MMAAADNMTVEELRRKYPQVVQLDRVGQAPWSLTDAAQRGDKKAQAVLTGIPQLPPPEQATAPQVMRTGGGMDGPVPPFFTPEDTAGTKLHKIIGDVGNVYGEVVAAPVQKLANGVIGFVKDAWTGEPNSLAKGQAQITTNQAAQSRPQIAPQVSTVPSQGEWFNNQGNSTYVKDGRVAGTVETYPGTGKIIENKPGPGASLTDVGNWNIQQGKLGDGTISDLSGPGRGSMSQADWDALPNEERIARNVAGYDAQTKALRDSRMERMAAMDGHEYDPTTGHMKGLDGPPLVVGTSDPIPLLTEARERNLRAKTGGASEGAKIGDVLDAMRYQENARHNMIGEQMDAQKFGLDRVGMIAKDQRERQGLALDEARTGAQVAETNQKLSKAKQEEVETGITQYGLPTSIADYARGAAARFTGVPVPLLLTAIQRASMSPTDTPDGFTGAWFTGKKLTFGQLPKLTPDAETAFEAKVREQLAGMTK